MTDSADVIKIVDSLTEKTRLGSISWRRNEEFGEDVYVSETERFFYLVGTRDYDGEPPYFFEIWRYLKAGEADTTNKNMKMLDVVTINQYAPAQDAVKSLIEASRQNVAGLRDSLAEEVLRDLSAKDPF